MKSELTKEAATTTASRENQSQVSTTYLQTQPITHQKEGPGNLLVSTSHLQTVSSDPPSGTSLLEDLDIPPHHHHQFNHSSNNPISHPDPASPTHDPAPSSPQTNNRVGESTLTARPYLQGLVSPGQFNRPDQLNWLDRNQLMRNLSLFSPEQAHLFRQLDRKRLEFPSGFEKGNYFSNSLPIIASNHSYAQKITYCCSPLNGPCRKWEFCSKCAFLLGKTKVEMYKPLFRNHAFFHVTCSFNGDIPFNITNSTDLQYYWEAIKKSFKTLLKNESIDGAYMVHETKVRSHLPCRVLPHSHILVTADHFNPELIQHLSELISTKPGVELVPSIKVERISNSSGIERVIQYQTKAIDLQEAYVSAMATKVSNNPNLTVELNLEMKDLLDSLCAAKDHYNRVVAIGNLNSKTKNYEGLKNKTVVANRKRRARAQRNRPQ